MTSHIDIKQALTSRTTYNQVLSKAYDNIVMDSAPDECFKDGIFQKHLIAGNINKDGEYIYSFEGVQFLKIGRQRPQSIIEGDKLRILVEFSIDREKKTI